MVHHIFKKAILPDLSGWSAHEMFQLHSRDYSALLPYFRWSVVYPKHLNNKYFSIGFEIVHHLLLIWSAPTGAAIYANYQHQSLSAAWWLLTQSILGSSFQMSTKKCMSIHKCALVNACGVVSLGALLVHRLWWPPKYVHLPHVSCSDLPQTPHKTRPPGLK